jgi:hypothetical protein
MKERVESEGEWRDVKYNASLQLKVEVGAGKWSGGKRRGKEGSGG